MLFSILYVIAIYLIVKILSMFVPTQSLESVYSAVCEKICARTRKLLEYSQNSNR